MPTRPLLAVVVSTALHLTLLLTVVPETAARPRQARAPIELQWHEPKPVAAPTPPRSTSVVKRRASKPPAQRAPAAPAPPMTAPVAATAPEGTLPVVASARLSTGSVAEGGQGGDAGAPGPVTVVESSARVLELPAVRYPEAARLDEIDGVVELEVQLRADDTLESVRVLTSPHPSLSAAAESALKGGRFKTVTRNGVGQPTRFVYRYRFELR